MTTFAAAARTLAGAAGRHLGWPPHWFWQATPAELAAILDDGNTNGAQGMTRADLDTLLENDRHGR